MAVDNNYTNDADGNTLTGGGRTNSWDSQNRMVQCVNGSNTSTYQYGADGYRHRSTVNGTNTDFALDGDSVVRELRAGTAYATYLTGVSGPMYKLQNTNGTIRWYLYDGLGSVLGEVDPGGTVTTYAKYDVYGMVRSRTGTATSAHGFVGQLGHASEAETGLIFMRARYMDPVVGRFASEDPARNGVNWLVYCDENPVNMVDATGRFGIDWSRIWCLAGMTILLLGVGAAVNGSVFPFKAGIAHAISYLNAVIGVAAFCFAMSSIGLPGDLRMYEFIISALTVVLEGLITMGVLDGLSKAARLGIARVAFAVTIAYAAQLYGVIASIGADA